MAPQVIAVVLGTLFTFSLQQVSGDISNTTCGEYPPPPAGSTQQCYPTSCMATCTDPLRFPNGAKTIVISCRNNIWIPTNGGFTSIPNCQVQCSPACVDGQKCFYPFVECHCPDGFGGKNCKDAITCPANEFHRGCADSCKTTCRARAMGETCQGRCKEGCACSASMARDDRDNCVPLEKCPCYVNDLEIEDGRVEVLQNGDQYDI
ncbi:hypothetical protein B566_EDAN002705 [Ephemera danica]|nr:hypothetical protein B566_EDAN002705 [Ephemera danica]